VLAAAALVPAAGTGGCCLAEAAALQQPQQAGLAGEAALRLQDLEGEAWTEQLLAHLAGDALGL
jgi:hypothetical protein